MLNKSSQIQYLVLQLLNYYEILLSTHYKDLAEFYVWYIINESYDLGSVRLSLEKSNFSSKWIQFSDNYLELICNAYYTLPPINVFT